MYFEQNVSAGDKRASCSGDADLSVLARAAVGLEGKLPDSDSLFAGLQLAFKERDALIGGSAPAGGGRADRRRRRLARDSDRPGAPIGFGARHCGRGWGMDVEGSPSKETIL